MDISNQKELNRVLARPAKFDRLWITAGKGQRLVFTGVKWLCEAEVVVSDGGIVEFPDLELVSDDLALSLDGGTVSLPMLKEVGNFYVNKDRDFDSSVEFGCIAGHNFENTLVVPDSFVNDGRRYQHKGDLEQLDRWIPIANDPSYTLEYNPKKNRVRAGCRYFTIEKGINHWKGVDEEYDAPTSWDRDNPRWNRAVMFAFALTNLKEAIAAG
jgi:hypothetical protein